MFRFIIFNHDGKNSPTLPPAEIKDLSLDLLSDLLQTESYKNLTSTPLRAFSSNMFNILEPISSLLNM